MHNYDSDENYMLTMNVCICILSDTPNHICTEVNEVLGILS